MSETDSLLQRNTEFAKAFNGGGRRAAPARRLAILTCMDARLVPHKMLGLAPGDAHVIRNAGGVATDDALRSLVISQRLLGTREIVLIHHTDCGMMQFRDDDVKDAIESETGIRPSFALEAFRDLDQAVRQSMARIRKCPFVPHRDQVRGFVYDCSSGRLREVFPD